MVQLREPIVAFGRTQTRWYSDRDHVSISALEDGRVVLFFSGELGKLDDPRLIALSASVVSYIVPKEQAGFVESAKA